METQQRHDRLPHLVDGSEGNEDSRTVDTPPVLVSRKWDPPISLVVNTTMSVDSMNCFILHGWWSFGVLPVERESLIPVVSCRDGLWCLGHGTYNGTYPSSLMRTSRTQPYRCDEELQVLYGSPDSMAVP